MKPKKEYSSLKKAKEVMSTPHKRRKVMIAAAVIALMFLAYPKVRPLIIQAFPAAPDQVDRDIFSADVAVLEPMTLDDKIFATGTIRANQEVDLRAEVSGKITGLYIDEGSAVEKGELLVKINDNDLQAQLLQVENNLEMMIETEARQQQLFERGGSTQEDYDGIRMQLNNLRSELVYVEAQIERTEIRAPFDGLLGLKYVYDGSYISPTTRIASLQDISSVKIDFSVPERYSPQIKVGNEIHFTVQGVDSVFTGEVYAIEPQIDTQTRTLQVRATSDNEDGLLRPGAFADINLVLNSYEEAIMVPSIALIPDMGQYSVLKYNNGIIKEKRVKTGIRTNNMVQIHEGLNPQDTILVNGLLQLRDGMPVSIRNVQYLTNE